MSEIDVSFIIPHKGRENLLIETLRSIDQLDYDPQAIEVILVSQNTSHSEALENLKASLRLQVFHQPENLTISALRNFGVQHASGNYLGFLDADVALSPNWINAMLNRLNSKPNTALVSAMQQNGHQPTPLEKVRTALSNVKIDTHLDFLPGRNLFLLRETFDAVGGFPEHLVTCEDYYFTDRVNQLGRLYYSSDATYVHLGEDKDYGEMFKKEIWRGQSNLQSIGGRRVPLREWPSFIMPVAVLFFLGLAPVLAIVGLYTLALLSLLLPLTPIVLYTIRLYQKSGRQLSLWSILKFYLLYFPARGIGTLMGLFKKVTTSDHK